MLQKDAFWAGGCAPRGALKLKMPAGEMLKTKHFTRGPAQPLWRGYFFQVAMACAMLWVAAPSSLNVQSSTFMVVVLSLLLW